MALISYFRSEGHDMRTTRNRTSDLSLRLWRCIWRVTWKGHFRTWIQWKVSTHFLQNCLQLVFVFVMVSNASANDCIKWFPPLKNELRHLSAPKRAIISEFQSCSPSMFWFVFGFGSWLLLGSFSTLSSTFLFSVKIKTTK